MSTTLIVLCVAVAAVGMLLLGRAFVNSNKPLRSLFKNSLRGLISLFALKLLSASLGLVISINIWTLLISAILGLPGTILLASFG